MRSILVLYNTGSTKIFISPLLIVISKFSNLNKIKTDVVHYIMFCEFEPLIKKLNHLYKNKSIRND